MVIHYNYDSLDRLLSYSNGFVQTFRTYNDSEEDETVIAGDKIQTFTNKDKNGNIINAYNYTYDDAGNVTNIVSTGDIAYTSSKEYDVLNRLTQETIGNTVYRYVYDESGYLTSVGTRSINSQNETIENYGYNNSRVENIPSTIGNHSVTTNWNGSVSQIDSSVFTWKYADDLIKVQDGSHVYTYSYDYKGKRIEKNVDGVITQYIYSGDLLIRQITNNTNVIDFVYDSSSNLVGYKTNGNMYYYIYDANDLIVGVIDSSDNLIEQYVYDSYGNIVNTNSNPNSVNPFRYNGSYYDEETGLYYKNYRYYNPSLRIYMNLDLDTVIYNTVNVVAENVIEPITPCILNALKPASDYIINKITVNDKTSNAIRIGAQLLAGAIMAETIAFFAVVNTRYLPLLKADFGEDFAKSDIMQEKVIPMLSRLANSILPYCEDAGTYESKTGLRHLWFANMALGAPWAGYLLNFERTGYSNKCWLLQHTNYTTQEGRYMWQSHVGYSWIYDYFFSLGGPIDKVRLPFTRGEGAATEYYMIWCWKADYWNLGAGGEIGIYKAADIDSAENMFYQVDENLTVHARMKITYGPSENNSIVLNEFHQTNWWITSFSPIIQHANVDWINVSLLVRITTNDLNTGFREEFDSQRNSTFFSSSDWSKVTLFDSDNIIMCTVDDAGCTHYNDPDNGFRFKINF